MTATAVSIGDIFVDYVGDLTAAEYQDVLAQISGSTNIFTPIDVQVGGAGLQFAVEAQAAGFTSSTLIGKIGGRTDLGRGIVPDLPGNLVIEFLQQRGIHSLLAVAPDSETGRIIIIYLPPDRRLMLSDRLANALFMPSDITPEMQLAVRQAKLVHVSGYTFLQEGRRAAVLELIRHAKQGGAKVALDIVPHNFYKYVTLEQLCRYVGGLGPAEK